MMPHYAVYGSSLASSVEFPELAAAPEGAARWRFELVSALDEMRAPVVRGSELLYGEVYARLVTHGAGARVSVDDTADFDIFPDGSIAAVTRPGAWDDFLRAHLLGRVLAMAMFQSGWLPLHGSAVATHDGVIAFLAPKGFGKSSLALALVHAGAALVTDDTLPIEPTSPPRAWPGVHSLRVHEDALAALAIAAQGVVTREGKVALHAMPDVRLSTTPLPLAAIYLLAPTESPERAQAVVRTPFSPVFAAGAVTAHVKIGRMLGPDAAATMLERVAPIVRSVPVLQLSVSRELPRLPDVARTILEWHGGPA